MATQECIKQVIKQETLASADSIVRSNHNIDYESVLVRFQNLTIDSDETSDEDGLSHRSILCNRWQAILCKYSSDISIREKYVKTREDAARAQEHDIQLWKDKSEMLDCKVCLHNICTIICYPCKHFSMCFPCFNTSVIIRRDSCPVCRGVIHSYSKVYIT